MLPDFPKLRKEMSSHLMLKLHATVQEKEPILADIRGVTQHEGDIIAYDQLTGEGVRIVTEGFKEVQSAFVTCFEEVPSLVGERLDTGAQRKHCDWRLVSIQPTVKRLTVTPIPPSL
jgi:hypothetical protein